jgi:hypothetical protein
MPTRCYRPPKSSSGSCAAWSVRPTRSRSPGVAGGGTHGLHAQGQANVLGSGEHRDEARVLEAKPGSPRHRRTVSFSARPTRGTPRTQTAQQVGQSRPPSSRSRGGLARPGCTADHHKLADEDLEVDGLATGHGASPGGVVPAETLGAQHQLANHLDGRGCQMPSWCNVTVRFGLR